VHRCAPSLTLTVGQRNAASNLDRSPSRHDGPPGGCVHRGAQVPDGRESSGYGDEAVVAGMWDLRRGGRWTSSPRAWPGQRQSKPREPANPDVCDLRGDSEEGT
jgi:hypothetical protein